MLHIILGILKIAGVAIGALVLLLLLVMLAAALVPVRYRIEAEKKGESAQAEAKFHWLLHLVEVVLTVRRGCAPAAAVRILGFRLPFFGEASGGGSSKEEGRVRDDARPPEGQSEGSPSREGESVKDKAEDKKPEGTGGAGNADGADSEKSEGTNDGKTDRIDSEKPEETVGTGKTDIADSEKPEVTDGVGKTGIADSEKLEETDGAGETDIADSEGPEGRNGKETGRADDEMRTSSAGNGPSDFEKRRAHKKAGDFLGRLRRGLGSIGLRLVGFLKSMRKRLLVLPEAVRRAARRAERMKHRIWQLPVKISGLLQRPAALLDFWKKYGVSDISRLLLGEVLYLLRHYRARRIQGYLNFGTGDPALTGQLTGLVYLLLPARADEFEVDPDFYERKLETKVCMTGYVRAIHLIRVGIHVLRDENLRGLIRNRRSAKNS